MNQPDPTRLPLEPAPDGGYRVPPLSRGGVLHYWDGAPIDMTDSGATLAVTARERGDRLLVGKVAPHIHVAPAPTITNIEQALENIVAGLDSVDKDEPGRFRKAFDSEIALLRQGLAEFIKRLHAEAAPAPASGALVELTPVELVAARHQTSLENAAEMLKMGTLEDFVEMPAATRIAHAAAAKQAQADAARVQALEEVIREAASALEGAIGLGGVGTADDEAVRSARGILYGYLLAAAPSDQGAQG